MELDGRLMRMKRRPGGAWAGSLWMAAAMALASGAEPQTLPSVTFPGWARIGADFGKYQPPASAWKVIEARADRWDQCYEPGDTCLIRLHLKNDSGAPLSLKGRLRWVWIGDAAADELGGVRYVAQHEEASEALPDREVKPGEAIDLSLTRRLGARRGALGLFMETEEPAGLVRSWLTNVLVLFPATGGKAPESPFMADLRGVQNWQKALELPVLRKLGVKWIRTGERGSFARVCPKPGRWEWSEVDAEIEMLRRHDLMALFLGSAAPEWARSPEPLKVQVNGRLNHTPSPEHFSDWSEYWEKLIRRHGQVIRAVQPWNEPWEAGGISHWGSTGSYYRDLQKATYAGVKRADPSVLVGGNDSDTNINDNLFSDPRWRDYTDFLTEHGAPLWGQFIHRMRPPGIPLWNTEEWYSSFSDKTAQIILFEFSRGTAKMNVVVLGNFFTSGYRSGGYFDPKDQQKVPNLVPQPNAAGYNTLVHFLEGARFLGEPRPEQLPFGFLFERPADRSHVLVVCGQHVEASQHPWPRVWAEPGEALAAIPRIEGLTGVYDRYGVAVEPGDGTYTIPWGSEVTYFTAANRVPLDKVLAEIKVTRHPCPLEAGILDLTEPIDHPAAALRVKIANPLPQPIPAKIRLRTASGWKVSPESHEITLDAGETRTVEFRLAGAAWPPAGMEDAVCAIETPLGNVERRERIGARVLRRFTPQIDADSADWAHPSVPFLGIVPTEHVDTTSAAMPWEKEEVHDGKATTWARWSLAYDDQHLYFYGECRMPKRPLRPWDQSRTDWYELYPGGYAYKTPPKWPFTWENVQIAIDCIENPEDYLYPRESPYFRRYAQRRADYLIGFYETEQGAPQVWLYRQPKGLFRHRYPFSPVHEPEQRVLAGAKLAVRHDEERGLTRWEASIPWSEIPGARPGAYPWQADAKFTVGKWNGIYSAAGRGVSKPDGLVYQPHWIVGYSLDLPWKLIE
jgi:hypothetical protein